MVVLGDLVLEIGDRLWSLLPSLDLPTTTSVPVVSPVGWNGAARSSACTLGVMAGRKELLSVLTELASDGNSTMHKVPAISQPTMMNSGTGSRAGPAQP